LLEERILLGEVLDRLGLHLEARDLQPVGRLVTPSFAPVRFDTAFFTAHLPPGQQPEVWSGELTAGEFASASAALARWRQGEFPLTPPTVSILESIKGRPIEELPARLRPLLDQLDAGRMPAIWFAPGVLMIPLDCRGYPPTTHTNVFLIGTGPAYLVDPGSAEPEEQEKLFDALEGRRIDAIILTHHHPDHIGAATVCAERYRVPVLAHPRTAELLAGKVAIDRLIDDGATLDLGEAPHGRGRWTLEAIHTPGHAPGHLALWQRDYGLLFVADMVSTLSSVVITPRDGDLRQYLESLKRLQQYPARMLLPAHGPPTLRVEHVLAETLAHRAAREQQLLDTLAECPRTLDELVQELYRGYSQAVQKLAAQQVHAGLIKLEQDGSVVREEERWRRT
jgi:glyoxylase-like metal-dependent hydrolase (beta-lactamase superfamily II)